MYIFDIKTVEGINKMRKSFALIAATFLMIPGFLLAQIQVSGTVTDAQTGDKLVGANVIVEGTDTGTSTDVDGNYSVTVPAGLTSAKLTARYIGYKQSTVTVSESGTTDFNLQEDVLKMDAVMVTGVAGELTKTKTPFAIDKIDSDVLELAPSTTVESMIRGKSAGVIELIFNITAVPISPSPHSTNELLYIFARYNASELIDELPLM